MNCERIRDRFSSLWEKELTSLEEKEIRNHLSSCPECRSEFEQFEKTMQWLHSVEEVEVPDGFLPELYKKLEERKSGATSEGRSTGKWFKLPNSLKLPVQAMAMVAIVFLVLYLSKMMPTGVYHLKESKQTSSVPTPAEKPEQMVAHKEADEERKILERPAEGQRLKDVGQIETPAPAEERVDALAPLSKAEAKKEEALSPRSEIAAHKASDLREQENAKRPSAEPQRAAKGFAGKEKSLATLEPAQEIVLKISDREKVVSQLQELIKRFGGKVVTTEGNMFVASLPTGAFSRFEKEVSELAAFAKQDKLIQEKDAERSSKGAPEAKKKEVPKLELGVGSEGRTTVRILLIQE